MNPFTWLQDPLLRNSLGWTVVHYLWIGAAFWGLAAVGRALLQNLSPRLRYRFSTACLTVLTLLPVVIFGAVQRNALIRSTTLPPPPRIDYLGNTAMPPDLGQAPKPADPTDPEPAADNHPMLTVLGAWLIPCLPFGWLAGTLIYSLLLLFAAAGVENLRRGAVLEVDEDLLRRLHELKARLAITGEVLVGYSDQLVSPVLVGLTRPLILLPVSAMSGVSPAQLEMILLHELAHVRRWDNWVNLAQRAVEALLFFQPAVWSVSAWMREDREYCCDDAVIRHSANDRESYAHTLAVFCFSTPEPLLASAMAQTPLLGRIRNILNQKDQNMTMTRQSLVPAIALFGAFNLLAYTAAVSVAEANTAPQIGRAGDSVLTQMLSTYEKLASYEAAGTIVTEMSAVQVAADAPAMEQAMAKAAHQETEFSILLDRSLTFRLEWSQQVHPNFKQGGVAWSDGKTHSYLPSFESAPQTYSSQEMLLGAVQGVSAMLPETARLFRGTSSILSPIADSKITAEASLGGAACWVVTGHNSIKQDVTLWVDQQSHVVRRYRIVFDPSTVELPPDAAKARAEMEEKHPELKTANKMSRNRTITWQADFRDITLNQKLDPQRFQSGK